jgi:hypothetical protein
LPKPKRDLAIHGWLLHLSSDEITKGYFFWLATDQVKVDFEAKDYRPWVKERIGHRLGYAGFHKKPPKELKEGDIVRLFDENDFHSPGK